jgi:hypothetical protein
MRVASLSLSLSLLATAALSGCAGARWSVVDSRPLIAVHVAPAELHGAVDGELVAQRRATFIGDLRAHGYQVLDAPTPGVPTLTMKVDGTLIDDAKLHAPDDARHHIYNDLHYQFVAYQVHLDVVDAAGHIVVCGSASADQDPQKAMATLATRLVRDVPAAKSSVASR